MRGEDVSRDQKWVARGVMIVVTSRSPLDENASVRRLRGIKGKGKHNTSFDTLHLYLSFNLLLCYSSIERISHNGSHGRYPDQGESPSSAEMQLGGGVARRWVKLATAGYTMMLSPWWVMADTLGDQHHHIRRIAR